MSECPLCHSRDCLAHTQPAPTPSHQVALELSCTRRQIKALRAELAALQAAANGWTLAERVPPQQREVVVSIDGNYGIGYLCDGGKTWGFSGIATSPTDRWWPLPGGKP